MKRTHAVRPLLCLVMALPALASAQFSRKPLSHADSTAAISSFISAAGGSGYQYVYYDTYEWKLHGKDSVSRDTASVSFTTTRNVCTEMSILGVKVRILGHASNPLYSLWVYPQTKSYLLRVRDTAAARTYDRQTYQVAKIGTETVNGYSCIHARLTISGSRGKGTPVIQDIWTTTNIPGYSMIREMMTLENVTPKILQALESAGCNGIIVRMTMHSEVISSSMNLVRAGAADLPASLLGLPSGYTPAPTYNPAPTQSFTP